MDEIWKPLIHERIINGYQLSTFGRIRTEDTGPHEAGYHSTNGYDFELFILRDQTGGSQFNIKTQLFPIDDLLAMTFVEPSKDLVGKRVKVSHIDGNSRNNHVDNLVWEEEVEEWLDIDCFDIKPNLYEVSNFGNVLNKSTGKLIQSYVNGGYFGVTILKNDGKYIHTKNHRMVGVMFVPNRKNENDQVNHIDGDKLNNYWKNLEWITPKENTRHAHYVGLTSDGDQHYKALLSSKIVNRICELLIDDKIRGNVKKVLDIILTETNEPVSYDIIESIKIKKNWKSISDKYFNSQFFHNQLDDIIRLIYESALLNYGNSRNVFRHLDELGYIEKYNINRSFIIGVLAKDVHSSISDKYFSKEDIEYLRYSKIKLICETLLDTDFDTSETYSRLKDKIPYISIGYIYDIKRKHMFPEIVNEFF